MTLVELKYLVAVAETLNFRRAAERVFVSQPALSQAIARLEDELGVQLLARSKTEVSLTQAGAAVVAQARRVLDEAAKVPVVAAQGRDPLAGTLRLGMIPTVGPYILPRFMALAAERLPAMALQVTEALTDALMAQLDQGLLDAALLALPLPVNPAIKRQEWHAKPLYDEAFDVILPKGHALAMQDSLTSACLLGHRTLLLHSGHCFSNQVVGACPGMAGQATVLESNSLETVRHLVAQGQGISVLPRSAADSPTTRALLEVRPLRDPAPKRRVALVSAPDALHPQLEQSLIELLARSSGECTEWLVDFAA